MKFSTETTILAAAGSKKQDDNEDSSEKPSVTSPFTILQLFLIFLAGIVLAIALLWFIPR